MQSKLFNEMKNRSIDWIVLWGKRMFNKNLMYFLPEAQVIFPYLLIKQGGKPILIYENMEKPEALKSGFEVICRDEIISRDEIMAISDPERKVTAFYEALINKYSISGNVLFSGVDFAEELFAVGEFLRKECPFISILPYGTSKLFADLRRTKTEREFSFLREASTGNVEIFDGVLRFLSSCISKGGELIDPDGGEVTLGNLRQLVFNIASSHNLVFDEPPIIAMGSDAASPHSRGDNGMVIKMGSPIVMDLSPKSASTGYFSDMTRTFCMGNASDKLKALYEEVKEAYNLALSHVKPYVMLSEPDICVSTYFKEKGHPVVMDKTGIKEGYVHSLGHGIGLEVHEEPRISTYNRSSDKVFIPGDVFTIEPGLYYEGMGIGLRLEDSFILGYDDKLENLTQFPMELEILI